MNLLQPFMPASNQHMQRLAALAIISIAIGLSLLICWVVAVNIYDAAQAPPQPPTGGSFIGFAVALVGLVAFFLVFPLVAIVAGSFDPPLAKRRVHTFMLLALFVPVVLMAQGPDFLHNILEALVIVYAPLAGGWLLYSEALSWVRAKPERMKPATIAALVLLGVDAVFLLR